MYRIAHRSLAILGSALSLTIIIGSCALAPASPASPQLSWPTAVVALQDAPLVEIEPAAMPTLSNANVTPVPTLRPLPTALPAVAWPTTRPAGPAGLAFPVRVPRITYGAHAHLFWTDRSTPLSLAQNGGFRWIRQQIHWRDQEGPAGNYAWGAELDEIVASVAANDLKLLISIVRSPAFYGRGGGDGMPEDPQALGNFVAALVSRYKGNIGAIQIWNEQNLAHENGGAVATEDAHRYVELLKVAYTRIKEVDPNVIVVSGAPASTAVDAPGVAISDMRYYHAMFSYENGVIRNYVDALGVHPGGSANPPETLWPAQPSSAQGWTDKPSFYFRNVENVRRLMTDYGMDSVPVWITEFGWATPNSTPGFEFGNQVSLEVQAQYIVGAMRYAEDNYPWVDAMFLWNLNFAPLRAQNGEPNHEQASFGILNADFSPRPAYLAVRDHLAGR